MIVRRHSLLAGAADARGIVVVIDVLRAFSCSALMLGWTTFGAKPIGFRTEIFSGLPMDASSFSFLLRLARSPS